MANRAGREVAEDVVRHIAAACEAAGLVTGERTNRLMPSGNWRLVIVSASREDWRHPTPMLEIRTSVDTGGNVGKVKILCPATDESPVEQLWNAPTVRNAEVTLDTLVHSLRMILQERDAIIRMMAQGQSPPFDGLHWTWQVPDPPDLSL